MADWDLQRDQMVKFQIKNRGIRGKRVLDAFFNVPRHLFVPEELKNESYCDHPLPIGLNQTISQPYIVALMTQHLDIQPGDRVLEIGTGCGYQTAILAELAEEVCSVEIIPELADIAKVNLDKLPYNNINLRNSDGLLGWIEKAPFDGIIVTAAPAEIPMPLLAQLKVGGEIVVPVGTFFQTLLSITKKENGEIEKKTISQVRFVPMTGKIEKTCDYQLS